MLLVWFQMSQTKFTDGLAWRIFSCNWSFVIVYFLLRMTFSQLWLFFLMVHRSSSYQIYGDWFTFFHMNGRSFPSIEKWQIFAPCWWVGGLKGFEQKDASMVKQQYQGSHKSQDDWKFGQNKIGVCVCVCWADRTSLHHPITSANVGVPAGTHALALSLLGWR